MHTRDTILLVSEAHYAIQPAGLVTVQTPRDRSICPVDPRSFVHVSYAPDEGVIVRLRKSIRQIVKSDRRYLLQLIIVEQRVLDRPVRFAD